jgi:hypothetical protein
VAERHLTRVVPKSDATRRSPSLGAVAAGGTVTGMELHCDTCARQRIFERPAGTDHHRGSHPDRACPACGATILVTPVILLMDRRSRVLLRQRDDRRDDRRDGQRDDRRGNRLAA